MHNAPSKPGRPMHRLSALSTPPKRSHNAYGLPLFALRASTRQPFLHNDILSVWIQNKGLI